MRIWNIIIKDKCESEKHQQEPHNLYQIVEVRYQKINCEKIKKKKNEHWYIVTHTIISLNYTKVRMWRRRKNISPAHRYDAVYLMCARRELILPGTKRRIIQLTHIPFITSCFLKKRNRKNKNYHFLKIVLWKNGL